MLPEHREPPSRTRPWHHITAIISLRRGLCELAVGLVAARRRPGAASTCELAGGLVAARRRPGREREREREGRREGGRERGREGERSVTVKRISSEGWL